MSDFSAIAPQYRQSSTVQRSASELLFDLLSVGQHDDVLDLGCGTGHLTQRIATITDGEVVGVDPSAGMVEEARSASPSPLRFVLGSAESLRDRDAFDAIFCNSAFQWFVEPSVALGNCLAALRPGGRMAIQAPARHDYCPNFVQAVEGLRHDYATRAVFDGFRSPWLFLDTAEAYAALFRAAGFSVVSATIETVVQRCTSDTAMEVFESGAAAGYFNPACYQAMPDAAYFDAARRVVGGAFRSQTDEADLLDLTFHRIYLLAVKPDSA